MTLASQTANRIQGHEFLRLENVSLSFGSLKALAAVSLSIHRSDFLFITGPSGAGKTTLLNVLSGDIAPDKGSRTMAKREPFIARIFQDQRFLEGETVKDNLEISFDPSVYRSVSEFREDCGYLMKSIGLASHSDVKLKDLNGGGRQKVALLRALLCKPDLVLADEPTCAMDKESARKVFDLLNLFHMKRNLGVVWATHNRSLVQTFTGQIVHLDRGRVVHTGKACFI